MTMLTEIHQQAEVVRRLLTANQDTVGRVAELAGGDVDHALIAARGTSDNAARRGLGKVTRTR